MIKINLLPHREIKRKRQQKEFFIMLGVVVGIGIAIWFAMHTLLDGQLEEQKKRNAYLDSEIASLDKQIDEIKKLKEQTAALLQRKKVVESLQENRAETVHLLDQLVRQLPDGVFLKNVTQKGDRVTISGFAQSNARVSTFMRNLESSAYLERPSLVEIKAVVGEKSTRMSEFNLIVAVTRAKEDTGAKKPAPKGAASLSFPLASAQFATASALNSTQIRDSNAAAGKPYRSTARGAIPGAGSDSSSLLLTFAGSAGFSDRGFGRR